MARYQNKKGLHGFLEHKPMAYQYHLGRARGGAEVCRRCVCLFVVGGGSVCCEFMVGLPKPKQKRGGSKLFLFFSYYTKL